MKFKFYRIIILLLLLGEVFFIGNSASAVEYGGIGGRPAYPRADNPRTESIFVHTLNPGELASEGVTVINNTAERKNLLVYATDSVVSSDGAFACAQLVENKDDVGSWVVLAKSEVTLESLASETIPFTINAPLGADVGEHNGCIIIQEKKEDVTSAPGENGIRLSFRTGLRVAILVPGEITRKMEITGFKITKRADGKIFLQPQVKNLGNVSIDADIRVNTDYFFGKKLAFSGGQFVILRGKTSDWNFELPKPFWGGFYKAEFTVGYDAGQAASTGISSGESLTTLTGPSIWFFCFPSLKGLIIEIVILLVLIGLISLLIIYKKRKNWIKNSWVLYQVQPGDDINLLAGRFNVSWKLLASANKLKPPFVLNEGENLKVPPEK